VQQRCVELAVERERLKWDARPELQLRHRTLRRRRSTNERHRALAHDGSDERGASDAAPQLQRGPVLNEQGRKKRKVGAERTSGKVEQRACDTQQLHHRTRCRRYPRTAGANNWIFRHTRRRSQSRYFGGEKLDGRKRSVQAPSVGTTLYCLRMERVLRSYPSAHHRKDVNINPTPKVEQ
jgi:hypothetical protein